MKTPWISFLIPVLHGEHLQDALCSLKAQEDADGIEVVVTDDGSSDPVDEIAKSIWPGATIVKQKNGGPAAARNAGLDVATAPVIGFLDADDILAPGALNHLRQALSVAPKAAGVQGMVRRLDVNGTLEAAYPGYNLGAMILRRSALDHVGAFNSTLRVGEDVDLLARLKLANLPILPIAQTVLHYRNTAQAVSTDLLQRRLMMIRDFRRAGWSRDVQLDEVDEPVTAVLVVKDGMPQVTEAIDSIRAQTARVDRILAIVGASTDQTLDALQEQPDVDVVAQVGDGLASARNQAVASIKTGWLAFLDHDDLWHPQKIERQIQLTRLVPQPCAVVTRFETEDPVGQRLPDRVGWTPSSVMVHRAVFDQIGLFDPDLGLGCDSDWFRRLQISSVPSLLAPQVLLKKRRHGRNLSASSKSNRDAMFAMLAKHRNLVQAK